MRTFILILLLSAMAFSGGIDDAGTFDFVNASENNQNRLPNTDKASEFELKDQYNKLFSVKFPKDKATVLIFGDREGSAQIEGWIRPLVERYADKIDIYGVAELSAVPGVAQGVVRRIKKRGAFYEVFPTRDGKRILKLVSENGVPLAGEKLAREERRVVKDLTEAEENSDFILTDETWAIVMLVAAGTIASFVTLKSRGNRAYALTVVWGLIGVIVANLIERTNLTIAAVAGISIVVIAVALFQARTKSVGNITVF